MLEQKVKKLSLAERRKLTTFRLGLIGFMANLVNKLEESGDETGPSEKTDACYEALAGMVPPEMQV